MDICTICGSKLQKQCNARMCGIRMCDTCGHVQVKTNNDAANARAHAWGGNSAFDRVRLWLTLRRLTTLFLRRQAQCSVLDIGFGSGILLRGILDRGCQVAGVDKNLLDVPVDQNVREHATLYHGDIDSVSLPANSFDLVLGIHVIEHVEDAREFARICCQSLKPGGHLYLLTPNAASAGLRLFGANWWNLEDPSHVQFFSPRSIRMVLEAEGFDNVRASTARWDSLTVETNSLWRCCGSRPGTHGVLAARWLRIADIALLPCALLARLVMPSLASTLEVVARKKA